MCVNDCMLLKIKEDIIINVNAQRLGRASVQGYYPWSCTGANISCFYKKTNKIKLKYE